jgi:GDP-L-fucose synthase
MNKDIKYTLQDTTVWWVVRSGERLTSKGYTNLIGASSKELDLRNQQAVKILWLPKTGSD